MRCRCVVGTSHGQVAGGRTIEARASACVCVCVSAGVYACTQAATRPANWRCGRGLGRGDSCPASRRSGHRAWRSACISPRHGAYVRSRDGSSLVVPHDAWPRPACPCCAAAGRLRGRRGPVNGLPRLRLPASHHGARALPLQRGSHTRPGMLTARTSTAPAQTRPRPRCHGACGTCAADT